MVHDEVFWEVLELLSRFDLEMKKTPKFRQIYLNTLRSYSHMF